MKMIIIAIFAVNLIGTGAPTFDAAALAQAVKYYEHAKTALKEAQEQTKQLTKQIESLEGMRKTLSDTKKSIYGEIHYWKKAYKDTKAVSKNLVKTVLATESNIKSMFDMSDGNYYNGKYKNVKLEKMKQNIISTINKNIKNQSALSLKEQGKTLSHEDRQLLVRKQGYIEASNARYINKVGGSITYQMFENYMQDKTKENEAVKKEIEEYSKILETETSLFGMSHLSNRLLFRMLGLMMESLENTKKFHTAMLFKNYSLVGGDAIKIGAAEFLEDTKNINNMNTLEQSRKYGKGTGRTLIESLQMRSSY